MDYETFKNVITNINIPIDECNKICYMIDDLPIEIKDYASNALSKIYDLYNAIPEIPVNIDVVTDKIFPMHSPMSSASIVPSFIFRLNGSSDPTIFKIKMGNEGMQLFYQNYRTSFYTANWDWDTEYTSTEYMTLSDIKNDKELVEKILRTAYKEMSQPLERYINAIHDLKGYLLPYL